MSFIDIQPALLAWSTIIMLVLFGWVMWPRNKSEIERRGLIPLDDEK